MRFADNSFVTCPGSPEHILYAPKVLPSGEIELVPSGVENTDDKIQSFAESTDIRMILARVEAGDMTALQARPRGSFGDFTEMPKTFAEVLQLQIDSKNLFDSLPKDIKDKFNGDSLQFFAQAGSDEWLEKLDPVLPNEIRSMIKKPGEASVDPVKPVSETE